jgi:hypothetical protein
MKPFARLDDARDGTVIERRHEREQRGLERRAVARLVHLHGAVRLPVGLLRDEAVDVGQLLRLVPRGGERPEAREGVHADVGRRARAARGGERVVAHLAKLVGRGGHVRLCGAVDLGAVAVNLAAVAGVAQAALLLGDKVERARLETAVADGAIRQRNKHLAVGATLVDVERLRVGLDKVVERGVAARLKVLIVGQIAPRAERGEARAEAPAILGLVDVRGLEVNAILLAKLAEQLQKLIVGCSDATAALGEGGDRQSALNLHLKLGRMSAQARIGASALVALLHAVERVAVVDVERGSVGTLQFDIEQIVVGLERTKCRVHPAGAGRALVTNLGDRSATQLSRITCPIGDTRQRLTLALHFRSDTKTIAMKRFVLKTEKDEKKKKKKKLFFLFALKIFFSYIPRLLQFGRNILRRSTKIAKFSGRSGVGDTGRDEQKKRHSAQHWCKVTRLNISFLKYEMDMDMDMDKI